MGRNGRKYGSGRICDIGCGSSIQKKSGDEEKVSPSLPPGGIVKNVTGFTNR